LLSSDLPKATAFLRRKVAELEQYRAVAFGPTSEVGVASSATPTTPISPSTPEITWEEHRAIFKRMAEGAPITLDDLQKLSQPISDLQTGTLAEDKSRAQFLLDAERYFEAMRDSHEAQTLQDAILATLKALQYWRTRREE
jgi:hypothetical protein